MKSTGIVRNLDQLGRISLPIEIRRKLDIDVKDGMEIFVDEDMILFRKYAPGCAFCGESSEDVLSFRGKTVCRDCRDQLVNRVVQAADPR